MRATLLDKTRLFDGADVTVMHREGRWQMIMGELADPAGHRIDLRIACLPHGATADSLEWAIGEQCAPPAPPDGWDATGYHCVSYASGWSGGQWAERLYYASAAAWTDITGPYSIGFLEWDGSAWARNPEPVFTATEPWERGTVAEPNLLYHDGRWLLWYCAGLSAKRAQVVGYAESPDGVTGWTGRRIFAADGEFDAAVADTPRLARSTATRVRQRRHAMAPGRRVETVSGHRRRQLDHILQRLTARGTLAGAIRWPGSLASCHVPST